MSLHINELIKDYIGDKEKIKKLKEENKKLKEEIQSTEVDEQFNRYCEWVIDYYRYNRTVKILHRCYKYKYLFRSFNKYTNNYYIESDALDIDSTNVLGELITGGWHEVSAILYQDTNFRFINTDTNKEAEEEIKASLIDCKTHREWFDFLLELEEDNKLVVEIPYGYNTLKEYIKASKEFNKSLDRAYNNRIFYYKYKRYNILKDYYCRRKPYSSY